jgi:hypothetical protein
MLEMDVLGIKPKQFLSLFETIHESQTDWNEHCLKCEYLPQNEKETHLDVFATYIKSPAFFLAGRVFIDARYMLKDPNREEYIAIFSSLGNEEIIKDYVSTHDLEGSALAKTVISGHWWIPIYDSLGNLVGTKAIYVNQSDFGGNIPKWLQAQFAPRAIIETYDALIKAASEINNHI